MASLLPEWIDREVRCFILASILVVLGTLATGFLPSKLHYQLLAGGMILGGFVLIFACIRDVDSPRE